MGIISIPRTLILLAWIGCLIFVADGGSKNYSKVIMTDKPLAYWSFDDGNVNDLSGNNFHGEVVGELIFGEESAYNNLSAAVDLNGKDAFIKIPKLGKFEQSSIEVWVKIEELNWRALKDSNYLTSIFSTNDFGAGNHHLNVQLNLSVEQSIAGGGPNTILSDKGLLELGKWFHIVSTYDSLNGGVGSIYLNGVKVKTGVHAACPVPNFGESQIGAWCGRRKFNGKIDEVAIYKTVLKQSQIVEHYNAAKGGKFHEYKAEGEPEIVIGSNVITGEVKLNGGRVFEGDLKFSRTDNGTLVNIFDSNRKVHRYSFDKLERVSFQKVGDISKSNEGFDDNISPLNRRVWLKGRSMLVGKIANISPNTITLKNNFSFIKIPRSSIAYIDFVGNAISDESLKNRSEGVLLKNKDYILGKMIKASSGKNLVIKNDVLGNTEISMNSIQVIKLGEFMEPSSDSINIRTRSGSLIHAQSMTSDNLHIIIRENSRFYLRVYAGEVVNIAKGTTKL